MTDEIWNELLLLGHRKLFRPGHILLHQGADASSVIVLTEGIVRVWQSDDQGRSLTMTLRGPGEVLGEYGVLLERRRSASVAASTRCAGHTVSAAAFQRFAERHHLTATVLQLAVERLEQREHLDAGLAHLRPESRLAAVLVALAAEVGSPSAEGIRVDLGMPREHLAVMASMSRSLALQVLRQLQAAGLVLPGRQHVTIVDLPKLTAVAAGESVQGLKP
ncbi:Crp/Fnr family transcriptional regulator [Kribbella albertanoniae]|uniref:Crp/Fnr family transcriptional regulator n=1 Tax=Kribbella albertanoniae TaxID=1266829 RepID=UPI00140537BC|nr:Crp/Fnr family transcriptional regulator [Kribbella albertanoniae]